MRWRSRARTVLRDTVTAAVVYVVALGGLFLVANAAVIGGRCPGRVDRTRLEIGNLENGLKLYRAKTGRYPDAATGFAALLERVVVDKEPRDAWGNPYRYELVNGRPVITSFGADGQPGGEGDAADISNRRERVSAR